MKKRKLQYVNLYSSQNKELVDFYESTLGLTPDSDNDDSWFGFQTGETQFAIEPQSNRASYDFEFCTENPILIQFAAESADDLRVWTEELESKGVEIKQRLVQKSYGLITTLCDPDGNVIELIYQEEDDI